MLRNFDKKIGRSDGTSTDRGLTDSDSRRDVALTLEVFLHVFLVVNVSAKRLQSGSWISIITQAENASYSTRKIVHQIIYYFWNRHGKSPLKCALNGAKTSDLDEWFDSQIRE